ncbi:MAG: YihY/virulence factor BrkB family protein [Desulfuromonadales bacterium]
MARTETNDRGRQARKPGEIPKQGWRDVVLRVKDEQKRDNLSVVAAGVAFYSLLAIFPALAAAVSIYGLVADPAQLQQQLQSLSQMLPQQAYQILDQQLSSLVRQSGQALGLGVALGILVALWSANKGMKALITSLNITYNEKEKRGFFKLNGLALLLTFGAIVFFLISMALIVIVPALLGNIGLPSFIHGLVNYLRWPLLAFFVIVALAVLYHMGPSRDRPRWQWVSWGAIIGATLWIVASILFSVYVANFGSYNKTYGSMGAVIILLMWFFLTAYAVLIGAEFNAEMEHQTRRDTTRGEARPMGHRNARAADTVGRKR